MLALIASALLGLYIFVPDFLFRKFATGFVRLKATQRTRTEEITNALLAIALPFLLTLVLSWYGSWHVGNVPFSIPNDHACKVDDYQLVFSALYSEHHFEANEADVWKSGYRVIRRQCRFLTWYYGFLGLEIIGLSLVTSNFGRFYRYRWFRATVGNVLLRRISEWHSLLTPFVFPPYPRRTVEIDVMVSDGHLYRGTIVQHFVNGFGDLSGLLLSNAKRFRFSELEADRRQQREKARDEYWTAIADGAHFYVPSDKIVNMNIRYELLTDDLLKVLQRYLDSSGLGDKVRVSIR